MHSSNQGCN